MRPPLNTAKRDRGGTVGRSEPSRSQRVTTVSKALPTKHPPRLRGNDEKISEERLPHRCGAASRPNEARIALLSS